jgi:hypothetical protein
LITLFLHGGKPVRHQRITHDFSRRYINSDIQLITSLDEMHDQPNGFALKELCERASCLFKDSDYECLSTILGAPLYNLGKSKAYNTA